MILTALKARKTALFNKLFSYRINNLSYTALYNLGSSKYKLRILYFCKRNYHIMRFFAAIVCIFLLIPGFLAAQKLTNDDYSAYIKQYKTAAIREMKLYHIPASITLAQGMIESGCGKSKLAVESNNHFGIKCQKEWIGDTYLYDDDAKNECFRKYKSVEESYRDHSLFLTTRQRYASLFLIPSTDYTAWARGLKQAGYATNPDYANILIRLIENSRLYLYDDTTAMQPALAGNAEPTKKASKPSPERSEVNRQVVLNSSGRILFNKNYKFPLPGDFEYLYTSGLGRKVYLNYGVPFVFASNNDTWFSISKEFEIYSFQVYKQNDLTEHDNIVAGQMLYLEPKKNKNREHVYVMKRGDSMYSISQEKCIRLSKLLKYNKLKPGDEPEEGVELKLKR